MSRFPTNPEAKKLSGEGDRYYYLGDRNQAIKAYNAALKIEPDCVYILVQRGLALQENGLVKEAIRNYEQAIASDPEYGRAYYGRAWAKGWKKDFQGELMDAQKGYQLDLGNKSMYLRRIGSAYSGLNKFYEAIKAYSIAIEINPRDEGTIYNRALCYIKMKEYDLALRDLDRALELDPDWDWAFFQKGLVHEQLGHYPTAHENYEKALQYNPHYGPAIEGRSRVRGKISIKFRSDGTKKRGTGCFDYFFYILLCLVISPLMIYLGASEIHDENELLQRGVTTNAVLMNSRSENNKGRLLYEIQYKYSVNGGYTWYTCSDNTRRVKLWCPVTKIAWDTARSTGYTTVKFLPDRPWINRLVYHDPPSNFYDNLGAVALGIAIFLVVGLLGFRKDFLRKST